MFRNILAGCAEVFGFCTSELKGTMRVEGLDAVLGIWVGSGD